MLSYSRSPSPQPLVPSRRGAQTSLSPRGRGIEGEGVIARMAMDIFNRRINRSSINEKSSTRAPSRPKSSGEARPPSSLALLPKTGEGNILLPSPHGSVKVPLLMSTFELLSVF